MEKKPDLDLAILGLNITLNKSMPRALMIMNVKEVIADYLKEVPSNLQLHYNGQIMNDNDFLLYNGLVFFSEANIGDKSICLGLTLMKEDSKDLEEIEIDCLQFQRKNL